MRRGSSTATIVGAHAQPSPVARAAALITGDLDADALFATGHRHEPGIGTPRIRYDGGALGGRRAAWSAR